MTETQAARVTSCLRMVPLFADLTDEELEGIRASGTEVDVPRGEVYAREGAPIEHFYVVTQGSLRITKRLDGREVVINTYGPGVFFGEVPLLSGTPFLASGQALTDSRLFMLPEAHFRRLLSTHPSVANSVLRTMAERVQVLQSIGQERARLDSLGTLAAGLAHELNNPASAAMRATGGLRASIGHLRASFAQIVRTEASRFEAVEAAAESLLAAAASEGVDDPLALSEAENEVASWLEDMGAEDAGDLAAVLAGAGLGAGTLRAAFADVPDALFEAAVRYAASVMETRALAEEVEAGLGRVSEVVGRMEAYSFMDRAPLQTVDLHEGLEDTLAVLEYRMPEGVEVERDYDPDLPLITAYGGEINQVWTNLLSNALDAVGGEGRIRLRTSCERDLVLVEVSDDGPGIPREARGQVFEPFFTTKDVGDGTGLGLTVAYRTVVGRHGGDIRVVSGAEGTRFEVRLPVEPREGGP